MGPRAWAGWVVVGLACTPQQPAVEPATRSGDALEAFDAWRTQQRPELSEGLRLAKLRRDAFRALIHDDPQLAVKRALSPPDRAALPGELRPYVERWVDGTGTLEQVAATADDGAPAPPIQRYVRIGDEHLEAHVYGARAQRSTRAGVRIHGVALDGAIAVLDSPVRRLFPGEAPAKDLPFKNPSRCPISRLETRGEILVNAGDAIYDLCSEHHVEALGGSLDADEEAAALAALSTWTTGPKTILFMVLDFSDASGAPISQADATTLVNTTVNNFYVASSYNQTTVSTTVTPVLRMPQTRATYASTGSFALMNDATAAAKAAGFDPANYMTYVAAHVGIFGWRGQAMVGYPGIWLNGAFDLTTMGHELGHNYGLNHAHFWSAGLSIIGTDSNYSVEYGDPFDIMGSGGGSQFGAWHKFYLGWFRSDEAQEITQSGTYRIAALEQPISSGLHTVKIPRADNLRDYWLEFRTASGALAQNGALVKWGFQTMAGSQLLNMHPESGGGAAGSPLLIGQTFSDPLADVHLTPIGKAGTTPEALDVVVNLGPFPGNVAPTLVLTASTTTAAVNAPVTFTASAADADGDPLAYAWSFGDGSIVPNQPTVTKSWSAAGYGSVRCVVSDMKGHQVSRTVLVTVGAPAGFVLSGTVTLDGQPADGVRISDGTRAAYSDVNGHYALSNVPAGSATLTAQRFGASWAASFTNPLAVSGSQSGLDFAGTSPTYSISGQVTPAMAGVAITDGSQSTQTDGMGNFTLTHCANGRHRLTATRPGWAFLPAVGTPSVADVWGANVTGLRFAASGQFLGGVISGAPMAATVTDGVRVATATGSGTSWFYSLQNVPDGRWNIVATLPGYTLTPMFTNPVTVAGQLIGGLGFTATATPSHQISGVVTTGGLPMPGVTVSAGSATSTTDSAGRYVLIGLADGSYTVTPAKAGSTFMPASRTVVLAGADQTDQGFASTVVNPPPTVATAAAANPSSVSTTTTALSVLGADDSGEPALVYTWSAPGGAVTFSANGTNAAKHTTATFSAAGLVMLDVEIRDPGGLTVHSQVLVTVTAAIAQIAVTPVSATVAAGGTQQLTASASDQFGHPVPLSTYTWSVSGGGVISPGGLFTAGASPGGPFIVTATGGGVSGTAAVMVTAGADNAAPTVQLTSPAAGTTESGAFSVTAEATDDVGVTQVTLLVDGQPGPSVTAAPYRWPIEAGALQPGPHLLSARAADAAGHTTDADPVMIEVGTGREAPPVAVDARPEGQPPQQVTGELACAASPGGPLGLLAALLALRCAARASAGRTGRP